MIFLNGRNNIFADNILAAFAASKSAYQQHTTLMRYFPTSPKQLAPSFSDLSMTIYGLYGYLSPEELEDLIDLALLRTEKVFGKQHDRYFSFAYHKNLVVRLQEQSINLLSYSAHQ